MSPSASHKPLNSNQRSNLKPIHASTLFEVEQEQAAHARSIEHWKTGLKGVDANIPSDLWCKGTICGISPQKDVSDVHELTTWLLLHPFLGQETTRSSKPLAQAYIIYLHGSFDHSRLFSTLTSDPRSLTCQTSEARSQILDSISLLPYFDLAGLAECISEISTLFHKSESSSSSAISRHSSLPSISLTILNMPSAFTAALSRGTSSTKALALLSSITGNIRSLSSSQPNVLIILETDVIPLLTSSVHFPTLQSAFSHPDLLRPLMQTRSYEQKTGTMLAAMRLLDEACDKTVWIHDAGGMEEDRGRKVVEVLKDRVGKGLGHWGVWESQNRDWK